MILTSLRVFFIVLGLLGVRPIVGLASEDIRVSLSDSAAHVMLTSSHPIDLRFPSGRQVVEFSPVHIEPLRRGLKVSGRRLSFTRVIARAHRGELRVSVSDSTAESVREPAKEWQLKGRVEIRHYQGRLLVVNHVDVEDYVAGVVTGEINTSWHPEALKAQAVAARTYVLYKKMMNQEQPYDVVSSVQDQVYEGQAQVDEKVQSAIRQTKGKVITYQQRPILAAYSSTAAGPTEDASYVWDVNVPYLKGVECPFDDQSPRYRWQAAISLETLERKFRKLDYEVGSIATITPFTQTPSGRIDRIRILHSRGQLIVTGQDFRRIAGYSTILSTQFQIESLGRELVVKGKGAGHGVGLCQWGMKEMADLGYGYEAIVRYYYPETDVLPLSQVTLTPPILTP
ncbi:MAG: SpoIID/LytB domain-containing protein [Nitrospirales bacterium]|nr:SpoIID/LytB domain-containing protein [Nitrospira sp.]MDR4502038.1 SpoIID/LytB domain-containing protein [Nitrospirales bacterium]